MVNRVYPSVLAGPKEEALPLGGEADGQLLQLFLSRRDEEAFALLVRRHGSMVLGVCTRVLRDRHTAEDAFQVTFLTLALKAGSISKQHSVGSWLYKVAYRVALRFQARAAGRGTHELPADGLPAWPGPGPEEEAAWRELRPVLDSEVNRLPEKYRVAFVLCQLEGLTNEEAAEQIGCPKGTVLSRLSRARERLRERLQRRGMEVAALALPVLLARPLVTEPVAPALAVATAELALLVNLANLAVAPVPASMLALLEETLHEFSLRRLFRAALAVAVLFLAVAGTSAWAVTTGGLGTLPFLGASGSPDPAAQPLPVCPGKNWTP